MSQTEIHYGKLRKVDLQGKSLEQFFEDLCRNKGKDLAEDKWSETWQELWKNNVDDGYTYYIHNNDVYEMYDHIEASDEDIEQLIPNGDGTFSFVMSFYNGGTCLGEMIDNAFNNLNDD